MIVFRKIDKKEENQAVQLVLALPSEVQLGYFYWPPDKLLSEFEVAESYGAFVADELKAFVLWRNNADVAEIMCLATGKDSQRSGLMAQLLNSAISVAHCMEWVLEVHESNLAAQALYRKLNFECVGLRKDYYRDGGNALIFKRKT